MVGISYLLSKDAKIIQERLERYDKDPAYADKFWEETLYEKGKMIIPAKVVHAANIVEINTFDSSGNWTAIPIICSLMFLKLLPKHSTHIRKTYQTSRF